MGQIPLLPAQTPISIIPIRVYEFSERLHEKLVQLGLCCAHAIGLVKGQGLARETVKQYFVFITFPIENSFLYAALKTLPDQLHVGSPTPWISSLILM
jgi:hypothetical protein